MDDSTTTSREERIRDAVTLAKNMRNNGASLETIEARLARRGFDKAAIEPSWAGSPRRSPTTSSSSGIPRPDSARRWSSRGS